MTALLVETTGEHTGRAHALEPGAELTIGRTPDNAIVVSHILAIASPRPDLVGWRSLPGRRLSESPLKLKAVLHPI